MKVILTLASSNQVCVNTLTETSMFYFYCNRSGHFETQSTGKRHIKSQGSVKINAHCTATMVVANHSRK